MVDHRLELRGRDGDYEEITLSWGPGPVVNRSTRDTSSTFEPQIVKKWKRRLTGIEKMYCLRRQRD
jgi:hypothetical protein